MDEAMNLVACRNIEDLSVLESDFAVIKYLLCYIKI